MTMTNSVTWQDMLWGLDEPSISTEGVTDWIYRELVRAIRKHTLEQTPMNPDKDIRDSYIILAEEVGEVARALTRDEGGIDNLRSELIQVAAMATGMLIAMRLRGDIE